MRKLAPLVVALVVTALALARPAHAYWCHELDNTDSYEECVECCEGGYPDSEQASRTACIAGCDTYHEPPTVYCVWIGATLHCWNT